VLNEITGKLILFWDYDTQWGGDGSRLPGGPKSWGNLEFKNTERLLALHDFYNLHACFAVVGAAALPGKRPYHDPQQIRRIHESGHEVASHSMYHEWLPGLGNVGLSRTLRDSKRALEDCIGSPVVSFVPPFNQPRDYPSKLSISLSERREARENRINLPVLFKELYEVGYKFCRVSYHSIFDRLHMKIFSRRRIRPSRIEKAGGLTYLRMNSRAGFGDQALRLVDLCTNEGGFAVIYGHPHSLHSGTGQDEQHLILLFEKVQRLISENRLQVLLPNQIVGVERSI